MTPPHAYEYHLKAQSPYSGNRRSVPWIQMKGHWLRQAGFEINTPVKVRVMAGCLVLTVE
ncbi:SymE family type I addiction module toxin [Microbulbifer sp. 2201CG32-9]|uniref:SymE family type I addiction module toxin n=1 Tax=Microbulbifer sp. 2201CG32-9 TaxID=3232309 RepID=UPI00345B83ED